MNEAEEQLTAHVVAVAAQADMTSQMREAAWEMLRNQSSRLHHSYYNELFNAADALMRAGRFQEREANWALAAWHYGNATGLFCKIDEWTKT